MTLNSRQLPRWASTELLNRSSCLAYFPKWIPGGWATLREKYNAGSVAVD
jgi:hypothetical protein